MDAMAAKDGVVYMGPIILEEGVTFSRRLSDRVFRATGVRAAYRARAQWGREKIQTLAVPVHRFQEAQDLVTLYGSEPEEPSGGDDDDDDAPGCGGVEAEARPRGTRGADRGGRQL